MFEKIVTVIISIVLSCIATLLAHKLYYYRKQENKDKHAEKMEIFKTLMSERFVPVSFSKTKALNSIQIVFYNCTNVVEAWHNYHDYLCKPQEQIDTEKARDYEVSLLEAMAKDVGYDEIDWTKIKRYYSPQGISNDVVNNENFKKQQLELIDLEIKYYSHKVADTSNIEDK